MTAAIIPNPKKAFIQVKAMTLGYGKSVKMRRDASLSCGHFPVVSLAVNALKNRTVSSRAGSATTHPMISKSSSMPAPLLSPQNGSILRCSHPRTAQSPL